MKLFNEFLCPKTLKKLELKINKGSINNIIDGELFSSSGPVYKIIDNIPNLVYPTLLPKEEIDIIEWYNNNYEVYDEYLPLTFKTFNADESLERSKMINKLEIKPDFKILETGAGTGRDSIILASKLGKKGELHVHDIFDKILLESVSKLDNFDTNIYHCVANAIYLPYPDNYFDIYYHFGGFNTFSDKRRAFKEINRVVKPGGKVIVGDESMPVWLRDTEFGKILLNSNPHYEYHIPFDYMDVSSRNVSLHYIIGGVFFYIFYEVGEGEPNANFDFEIPGLRGGTHRTRYYGHLEGVSDQAIKLAHKAREKSGKSLHKWLDDIIKKSAKNELK